MSSTKICGRRCPRTRPPRPRAFEAGAAAALARAGDVREGARRGPATAPPQQASLTLLHPGDIDGETSRRSSRAPLRPRPRVHAALEAQPLEYARRPARARSPWVVLPGLCAYRVPLLVKRVRQVVLRNCLQASRWWPGVQGSLGLHKSPSGCARVVDATCQLRYPCTQCSTKAARTSAVQNWLFVYVSVASAVARVRPG